MDAQGITWEADHYYSGGQTYSTNSAIANTLNDYLFQTERYGNTFAYSIPLPNGIYTLVLHFAEIYWTSGSRRIFNITAESFPVATAMDIWNQAGSLAPLQISSDLYVADGTLNVSFNASADNAKLSALEVHALQGGTASSGESITRINAGGGDHIDTLGYLWQADSFFNGGSIFATTNPIGQTNDDPLYQTERFGTSFSHDIPVVNGTYLVILHFAEIYWTTPGLRLFDVFVEGSTAVNDLDLTQEVGSFNPFVLSVQATVTDGELNILYQSVIDNAKVSAIEVQPLFIP